MPQHPFPQRLTRARRQWIPCEELLPQVRGDALGVRVRVVRRRVPHQVPEPQLPARAVLDGHERMCSLDPRGNLGYRTVRQRRRIERVHLQVRQREDALLLQVGGAEELLGRAKSFDHCIRHRIPGDPVRSEHVERVRVPREVLKEMRWNLHHVHGAPRAAQVLVPRVREHRVHGVAKLVKERLNLRVAQRRRGAGAEIANQRHRGPLLVRTGRPAAAPDDEVRGVRELPGPRLEVEVDGADLFAFADPGVPGGDSQLAHLRVPALPGIHWHLREFHPEHPVH